MPPELDHSGESISEQNTDPRSDEQRTDPLVRTVHVIRALLGPANVDDARVERLAQAVNRATASGAGIVPAIVGDFIARFAEAKKPSEVLDPWPFFGLLLGEVLQRVPVRGTALAIDPDWLELGRGATTLTNVEWILADPRDEASWPATRFDLVVASLPAGLRAERQTFRIDGEAIDIRDRGEALLALRSALSLSETGSALLFLPVSFCHGAVWSQLAQFGLHAAAVIGVPSRLMIGASVPGNLVLLQREPVEGLFVGVLEDPNESDALLANLLVRRSGEAPPLGRFARHKDFRSWSEFMAMERIEERARRTGLERLRLGDLATEIVRMRPEMAELDEAGPENAIYVSLYASTKTAASTNPEQLVPRAKSLRGLAEGPPQTLQAARVTLDPKRAVAEYLVTYFASELGQFVRNSLASGTTIKRIPLSRIQELPVFLPDLATQVASITLHNRVRDVRSQIASIEQRLWENPNELAEVTEEVERFAGEQERFEAWLEELPFPLASILWRYHAEAEPRRRVDHLLHYFEALAAFVAVVLLSAFRANQPLFDDHQREWNLRSGLGRPTFGTWRALADRLAETARELEESAREELLSLFHTDRDGLVRGLIDVELHDALAITQRYRNDWKGHDAIVGEDETSNRIRLLESQLSRVRAALAGAFSNWILVKPADMRKSGQIFDHRVEILMGRDMIFRSTRISSPMPMDSGELYLLDALQEHPAPLELIPFIRIKASPGSHANTCYFYSRLEDDGVRLVSYHFEVEADLHAADPDIIRHIEALSGPPQP